MKSEKGNFLCLCAAVVHIMVACVLFFNIFEKVAYDFYVISGMVAVGGLLSIGSFVAKTRNRFRPGWLLPQGLTGILIGVMMIAAKLISGYNSEKILLFSLPCIAVITAILHISASFQIKCLGYQRWWILLFFGMIDLIFGAGSYFYFLHGTFDIYRGFGVFFVMLALQFVAETITYKITVTREENDI